MSLDRVRSHLARFGLDDRIHVFDVSSATVDAAAAALGVAPGRIAKSLTFMVDGAAVLIVAAGDARIHNPSYKAQFQTKARMLSAEEAIELVGYAVGGICPFAVKPGCRVFLDRSLEAYDEVYPAAGSDNSAVRLSLAELEAASAAEGWIEVCRRPEG